MRQIRAALNKPITFFLLSIVAWLAVLVWTSSEPGKALAQVTFLEHDWPASEVLAGEHDNKLATVGCGLGGMYGRRCAAWWRVSSPQAISAESGTALLLYEPSWLHVEAWLPGAKEPLKRALVGPDADRSYSLRALVIPLSQWLAANEPIWLRVQAIRGINTHVSFESGAQLRRNELSYVAARAIAFTVIIVSVLLSLVFWHGAHESSFLWLAASMSCMLCYLALLGGDVRVFPFGARLHETLPLLWLAAGLTMGSMALFVRSFLHLPELQPRVARVLPVMAATHLVVALLSFLPRLSWLGHLSNLVTLVSVCVVVYVIVREMVRGNWTAMWLGLVVLPLGALAITAVLQVLGLISLPTLKMGQSLTFAAGTTALLMTLVAGERLNRMRRDRDHASNLADIDGLTGLFRRRAIERHLREQLAIAAKRGRPFTLAFIDLDGFKAVNDQHGHQAGDACLRQLSRRLRAAVRSGDLLGRYGGDEILLLMPNTTLYQAMSVLERLRLGVMAQSLLHEGQPLELTLSIGVAEWQRGEKDSELLARADAALYASKQGGRNRVSAARV